MTNKFGTTDDWEDGDVLYSADILDTFDTIREITLIHTEIYAFNSIMVHSDTVWSGTVNNGTIYLSSDSGATWTSKNTDLDTATFGIICKNDSTKAFVCEITGTAQTVYTADSGTTWTTKTSAVFGTGIYDISFPTANLIVIGGNDAAGTDHTIFSTDQGTSWTNATTSPGAPVYALDMWDGTTGYAIDSSNNIWKTVNAGVDWTDTGHNSVGVGIASQLLCLSATTFIHFGPTDAKIGLYDNGGGTYTQIGAPLNVVNYGLGIVNNSVTGDIFIAMGKEGGGAIELLRTNSTGTTQSSRLISHGVDAANVGIVAKRGLTQLSNGHLLLPTPAYTTTVMKIPVK